MPTIPYLATPPRSHNTTMTPSSTAATPQTNEVTTRSGTFARQPLSSVPIAQRPLNALQRHQGPVDALGWAPIKPSQVLFQKIKGVSAPLELDFFGSEASAPFTPVHIAGNTAQLRVYRDFKKAVTSAGLEKYGLTAAMLGSVGQFENADKNFFPWLLERYSDTPTELQNAKDLIAIMNNELATTKVIIVGKEYSLEGAQHPVFIVGIAPDGSLVGVQSSVVWT